MHDGRSTFDRDGREFDDWHDARRHAIKLAGKILDGEAHRIELGELWHMDVVDEAGLSLFRLDVYVTPSPALLHSKATAGELP